MSLLGTALRDASPQMSEWCERFAKGEEGENLTVDELSVLASYAAALEMSEQFGMGVVRRFGRELIDAPERLRFATPDVTHGNAIPLVWFTRDVVDAWSLAEELDWYVKTNGSNLLQ